MKFRIEVSTQYGNIIVEDIEAEDYLSAFDEACAMIIFEVENYAKIGYWAEMKSL